MGRKRTFEVTESLEELTAELSRQIGAPTEAGLRLLIALRRDPANSNGDLSRETGLGISTIKRLLGAYRAGGLKALKERAGKVRQQRPQSGVASREHHTDSVAESAQSDDAKYRKVLKLVREVPETIDEMEFLAEMRELLYSILAEVDYLVLVLTGNARLFDPASEDTRVTFVHIRQQERNGDSSPETAVRQRAPEGEKWRTVLEDGKKRGRIDFSRYHTCVGFDLIHTFAGKSIPLAAILLFREITSPPISLETKRFVRELEPLLTLIFVSYIARRQNYRRAEAGFEDLYREIDPVEVERVEHLLNNRPRKILGYATPWEIYSGRATLPDRGAL